MTTILLTSADNGRSIEARPGDEIVLHLAENPTTGVRWQVDRLDGALEQVADGYVAVPPPTPDAAPQFGRGGVREFRFRSLAPGTTRLELKSWQPWEGESSVAERFAIGIAIAD